MSVGGGGGGFTGASSLYFVFVYAHASLICGPRA